MFYISIMKHIWCIKKKWTIHRKLFIKYIMFNIDVPPETEKAKLRLFSAWHGKGGRIILVSHIWFFIKWGITNFTNLPSWSTVNFLSLTDHSLQYKWFENFIFWYNWRYFMSNCNFWRSEQYFILLLKTLVYVEGKPIYLSK